MRRVAALAAAIAAAGCGGGGDDAPPPPTAPPSAGPGPVAPEVRGPWTVHSSAALRARELWTPRLALRRDSGGLVAAQGRSHGHADCERRDTTGAFAVRVGGTGEIGQPHALGGDLEAGPVALGTRYAALLAEPLPGTTDCDPRSRLVLADLGPDGDVTERRPLAPRVQQLWAAAMDASDDTDVAVAWIDVEDETAFRLRAVIRSHAGELTDPVTIARGAGVAPQVPAIDGVDVALSAEGAALVAFVQRGRARLVTLRPDGTIVRRRRLGRSEGTARIRVAAGAGGRAAVAWGSQDGGEERNVPYRVRATTKGFGEERFAPARVVDPGGAPENPPGGLALALADDGRALLAWDQVVADGKDVTRYAEAPADGGFGPPRELGRRATLIGLAVEPDGEAAVALSRRGGVTVRTRSARGTRFVDPQRPTGRRVHEGDLAFDAGGVLLLAWAHGSALRVARRE